MPGRSLIGKLLNAASAPPVPMSPRMSFSRSLMGSVSQDEALMGTFSTQSTVHSNAGLLASSTAKPEWKLYRKSVDARVRYTTSDNGSDQRTEVLQHQALTVLNAPALPFWTRFRLFEISGVWLETTGKSHWVVDYAAGSSIPSGLWPVRPDRMQPVPDREKYLAGWVYTSPDGGEKVPLRVNEVVFNSYPDPLDPMGGCGWVSSVLTDVGANRQAAQWNLNFFANSAIPGGVIQVDHAVEDDEFNTLTDRWREAHRGTSRAHRVAVLEGGQTWVPNPMTVRDMDFSNLRTTGRDIIREAAGMHKVMTGVTDDVNRANAQTGEEVFASWKIVPRLDRWKDVLNFQYLPLFGSTGQGVEFDYSFPMPLNREQDNAELVAKATAAQLLVSSGYDPDDVLEVVGLPAMDTAAVQLPEPAAPAQDAAQPAEAPQSQDDAAMAARLRRVLSNGHMPVGSLR